MANDPGLSMLLRAIEVAEKADVEFDLNFHMYAISPASELQADAVQHIHTRKLTRNAVATITNMATEAWTKSEHRPIIVVSSIRLQDGSGCVCTRLAGTFIMELWMGIAKRWPITVGQMFDIATLALSIDVNFERCAALLEALKRPSICPELAALFTGETTNAGDDSHAGQATD